MKKYICIYKYSFQIIFHQNSAMRYVYMLITLTIGALVPIQAILNMRLGRITGGPMVSSLMSFLVGTICLLALNLGTNANAIIQLRPAAATPWYIWLGGVIGALFVGFITWINQQQGLALTFALVVSGQLFMSLLIDHFGLFGSAIRNITLPQVIGVILILAGLFLIKK